MELQSKFKRTSLTFCLFVLSIFLVYGVYASSYEEVSKSTATIVHEDGLGSGFFIDKNLLVTNYHVVEDAKDGVVFFKTPGGIKDTGYVVVADAESDLAIIRTLQSDYKALEMGGDVGLKMGDEIFVIGSPKGLGGTLSKGIISAQRRGDRLQITAPISSGSSGSPVFSKDFKVIGISVSYMPEGQNLNFAIPVSKLQELMQKNKVALGRVETEEAVRQTESSFDKELASYENKEDKTPQDMFYLWFVYYLEGNYQRALYWLKEAADQGDAEAQHNLAWMYNNGEEVAKDYQKALYWYQQAANQGHAEAQHNLAVMYDKGERVVKDYQKALYWYEKAANQGLAQAQTNLALIYHKSEGATKDHEKAVYWYQKAANQGLAEAQHNLALIYHNSEGVAKDYKKAVYWYEKAANQGLAEAQHNLALMYHKGEGVVKDYEKAVYWYEKAANQGYANAQLLLGTMYQNGISVAKDYEKAVYWYQKSANQGIAEAQFNLAAMYLRGREDTKDYKKAIYWLEEAGNQGHANAQLLLGLVYYMGKGVTIDYKKAFYWYQKAGNQGLAEAQLFLGAMYYGGIGITKNYVEAYKWAILSRAQSNEGPEKANKILDSLEKLMTPAQIAEAQELANQFEAQKE